MSSEMRERHSWPVWLRILITALALIAVAIGAWFGWRWWQESRHPAPEPITYWEASEADPDDTADAWAYLAEREPTIADYCRVWAAESRMPSVDAARDLEAAISYRPQSPLAYIAHIGLARHYADEGAVQAEDHYELALALHETTGLRLELARYLEEIGDLSGAYAQYKQLLKARPDSFADMRRTGPSAETIAQDLNAAYFVTDAEETLRDMTADGSPATQARISTSLGDLSAAAQAYRDALEKDPNDVSARSGLAAVLARQGDVEEALALYVDVATADSDLAQAQLLEESDPDEALRLYSASPYPLAWWSATSMLEAQNRLTETLPLYTKLAEGSSTYRDDAAYRLWVLGKELGEPEAAAIGLSAMRADPWSWLSVHATGRMPDAPDAWQRDLVDERLAERIASLSRVGRGDLAYLEALIYGEHRSTIESRIIASRHLLDMGNVLDAQVLADDALNRVDSAPLALWQLAYPKAYEEAVVSEAHSFGIDPRLVWAIMRQESRYDPNARGYSGERGLMQVMPATQEWASEQLGEEIDPSDAFGPQASVRMSAWLLNWLSGAYEGDLLLMIPAYNAGSGSVAEWLEDPLIEDEDDFLRLMWYGQTREYFQHVMDNYVVYQVLYPLGTLEGEQ